MYILQKYNFSNIKFRYIFPPFIETGPELLSIFIVYKEVYQTINIITKVTPTLTLDLFLTKPFVAKCNPMN